MSQNYFIAIEFFLYKHIALIRGPSFISVTFDKNFKLFAFLTMLSKNKVQG